ncbi:hypothetical protein P4U43_06390 [Arthrobacter sp. EH-1B-1]|uniref:Uncharacterized protein n=1 Tax=Arthrobacter vasquezii TaxID=2977629 RepID=A0ABT6CTM6_9MICC|nr:hypothetical protein [Arthrobacter vasquezii]MDF9277420.1 hypothetical protein [Arthrobacter vasquezii]
MEHTPDGANDLLRGQAQAALAVAGRLGEMLARQRAERLQELQRAANEERRQLEERFEAERAVMRTQLAAVHRPQFWESAQPQDIATHYALAQQWEPFDDMARLSREHMHDEIRDRYDLTPEQFLDGNAASPGAGIDGTREKAAEEQEAQQDSAEAEQQAATVAAGDLQNDTDTENAAAAADELWDSGDRRTQLEDRLMDTFGHTEEGKEAVTAVLTADRDQGTHPRESVRGGHKLITGKKFTNRGSARDREVGLG